MEQRNSSGGVKKREIFGSGRVGSTKTPSRFHSAATNHAVYNCALLYLLIARNRLARGNLVLQTVPLGSPRIPTKLFFLMFCFLNRASDWLTALY